MTVDSSTMDLWTVTFQTDFRKGLFGFLFVDNRFQNSPDAVILQKYYSLSNQSFKHNSAYVATLKLICKISFEPRFRMFIINGYYTKSKRF